MAKLSLDSLTRSYGDLTVVNSVSLDIPHGEFLVLLGPSGCGKTTTLRMIAGFVEPSSGSIRIGTQDVTAKPPWKRNCGLVFQNYALFPHMTVAENVAFGLEMRQVDKSEMANRDGLIEPAEGEELMIGWAQSAGLIYSRNQGPVSQGG